MLQPHFYFSLPGNIWKIRLDPETRNLVLEVRQPEILQASFWVINAESGKMVLPDFRAEERWWIGLEDAYSGNFLLHGFENARETGKHAGIQIISEISGQTKFRFPELSFSGFLASGEILAENKLGQLKEINPETGQENITEQTKAHAKSKLYALEEKRNAAIQFPVAYLPEDAFYNLLRDFIRQKTNRVAEQTIEYLETGNYIIISFYALNATVLANFLVVFSAEGKVLLDICLETSVTGLGLDTFFIFADKLFFIQEKQAVAAYLLSN